MAAIAVLGFLVWARNDVMGLPICEFGVIKYHCMLETSYIVESCLLFFISTKTLQEKSLLLNNQQGTPNKMHFWQPLGMISSIPETFKEEIP